MFDKSHILRKSLIASAVAVAVSAPAVAQDRASALEEVIVTAQKRSESLQDTPISISAFSQDTLEAIGVTEADQIADYTPNLQMGKQIGSNDNVAFNIRGVGAGETSVLSEQTVGLYMDGIYIARNTGSAFDIVDLERIEVLRGPQGALYGRNTIGGAINLITQKPADEFGFKQKFTAGNRGRFVSNTSVDTGKLGDFAAKLSYNRKEVDGGVKNSVHGNDLGHSESDAYRIALRWTPSDEVTVDYTYSNSERTGNASYDQISHIRGTAQAIGGSIYQQAAAAASQDRVSQVSKGLSSEDDSSYSDIDSHSLTIQWDLDNGMVFKSITSHREWESGVDDTDFGSYPSDGSTIDFASPGFRVPVGDYVSIFSAERLSENTQFTQEFQLQGSMLDDRLDYTVGLYYFEEESDEDNPQTVLLPAAFMVGTIPGVEFLCDINSGPATCVGNSIKLGPTPFFYGAENDSTAVYGQFIYAATDALDITLGLRYTKDNKEVYLRNNNFSTNPDDSWSNFSPSLNLNYQINEDVSVYATYSTGYRAGGYNARASSEADFNQNFDEETVTNYEAGIKSDWFDSRLRVNASIFHLEYDDAQVSQFKAGAGGASSIISNAGALESDGIELEITALPIDGLMITAAYGYVDAQYTEFYSGRTDPVTAFAAPSAAADAAGNEDISDVATVASSPNNSGSLIVSYDFEPTDWGQWRMQVDGTYTGDIVFHPQLNLYDRTDDQTRINARLTLSDIPVSKGNLSVAAWVKNLNNEAHREWGIDFSTLGLVISSYSELRSYGIDIVYEM